MIAVYFWAFQKFKLKFLKKKTNIKYKINKTKKSKLKKQTCFIIFKNKVISVILYAYKELKFSRICFGF